MFMSPASSHKRLENRQPELSQNPMAHHDMAQLLGSAAIAAPAAGLALFLLQNQQVWTYPENWVDGVLGLAVLNLLLSLLLEPRQGQLGRLTMPALLTTIALVMLYLLADVMTRFVMPIRDELMLPFLLPGLALCFTAIFREKLLFLKLFLALDGLMLAVMWNLGLAHNFTLSF